MATVRSFRACSAYAPPPPQETAIPGMRSPDGLRAGELGRPLKGKGPHRLPRHQARPRAHTRSRPARPPITGAGPALASVRVQKLGRFDGSREHRLEVGYVLLRLGIDASFVLANHARCVGTLPGLYGVRRSPSSSGSTISREASPSTAMILRPSTTSRAAQRRRFRALTTNSLRDPASVMATRSLKSATCRSVSSK